MHLKTIDETGEITLIEYFGKKCTDILLERNSYVLKKEHNFGEDYGGSQHSEECKVSYEEIPIEYVLVKNDHFAGICICRDFEYVNGDYRRYLEDVCLLIDGNGYARSGVDYSDDDHSRWDYTDIYLVEREEMNK